MDVLYKYIFNRNFANWNNQLVACEIKFILSTTMKYDTKFKHSNLSFFHKNVMEYIE
jgi:hypothetical protein